MKIAYIIPSLDNKGPILIVNYLVKFLKDKVDQIDVYYFDVLESEVLAFDCPVHNIKMDEPINFDDYDVIHSHCLRPDLYINKWRKKSHKAKIISTLHQDTYKSFSFQYNKIFSYILTRYWLYVQSKFDGVTVISKQLQNIYNKRLKDKATVIYNGCYIKNHDSENLDENILSNIMLLKETGFKVLVSYAYVTKRKGLDQIIKILPHLKEYALVIIGNGPEIPNLKKLSLELDIPDRMLFLEACKTPYLYLRDADIYVMPSYSEGFGLAMVEAAFQEKSILCSDIDSFHEIFTEKEATFFTLNNQESLKNAIREAYRTKDDKAINAFEKVDSKFRAEIMADNHLQYYKKILN